MRTTMAATLESVQGQVVLEEVAIDAAVDDLMTVVDVCQRYRNPGAKHIEAVYTFPLPVEAVLLKFAVEIGDRTLAGTVVAKAEAERRYEDAVTDGDAAVLLEQPQPGLYTASVGNLAPGETATVRFRYGLLLRWNGDLVRLAMPTAIAPRYGDPSAGGLDPHQEPEFGFDAERSLSVAGNGAGSPARRPLGLPLARHRRHAGTASVTVIEIARPAVMDRDVVLEAHAAGVDAGRALLDRDDGDWVVLASFRPEIPDLADGGAPRCLKIVVDCSGSMSGDSIEQVRIAGERILDSLRPGDLFDIVAFGTGHRALFGRAMPASPANVARAREFVRDLDADLGGTEIESALRAAYGIDGEPGMPRDLLLITDGEVWDTDAAIAEARASGHRIFTVGVGSAVAEPFVRALALATGGACELVAPREDMAEPHPPPLPAHPGTAREKRQGHLAVSRAGDGAGPTAAALPRRHHAPVRIVRRASARSRSSWRWNGPTAVRSVTGWRSARCRTMPPPWKARTPGAPTWRARVPPGGLPDWTAQRRASWPFAISFSASGRTIWSSTCERTPRRLRSCPRLAKVPQVPAAGWHGIGSVRDAELAPAKALYSQAPPPAASAAGPLPDLTPAERRCPGQLFRSRPLGRSSFSTTRRPDAANEDPVRSGFRSASDHLTGRTRRGVERPAVPGRADARLPLDARHADRDHRMPPGADR